MEEKEIKKRCYKCKTYQLYTNFYTDTTTKDGYANKCKECYKEYNSINREKRVEYIKKWRKNNREKYLLTQRRHRKKYHQNNKNKDYCRKYLQRAVSKGKISIEKCIVCENPITEAHHEDYNRPYNVIWFCREHHLEHHKLEI